MNHVLFALISKICHLAVLGHFELEISLLQFPLINVSLKLEFCTKILHACSACYTEPEDLHLHSQCELGPHNVTCNIFNVLKSLAIPPHKRELKIGILR